MRIGIPAESRAGETRVAGTPETVKKLTAQGHTVLVQSAAGERAHFPDTAYAQAGATLVGQPKHSRPTSCSRCRRRQKPSSGK